MKESDLYLPIKQYLTRQGYQVNSEVKHCDLTALKDEELIVIELKTRFSLKLIAQALRRQKITHSVYVAVPVLTGKRKQKVPGYKEASFVLRHLGIGLIFVRFLKTRTRVEIVFHPQQNPYVFISPSKRAQILREIDGRFAEFNLAGQSSRTSFISAYRQQSLLIAWHLLKQESASPASLKKLGTSEKTGAILYNNVFGWFERIKRGTYQLSPEGRIALKNYKEQIDQILKNTRQSSKKKM